MRSLLPWLLLVTALGCAPAASAPEVERRDPTELLQLALEHEASDALHSAGFLAAIEHSLLSPEHPQALAVVAASLDALVWREVNGISDVDHAIVHRSNEALTETTRRLEGAYASGLGTAPMRGLIADALHSLALRVGAAHEAALWRRRSGCVQRAAVAGPVVWPGLTALNHPPPTSSDKPMPAHLAGVAPFANEAVFETSVADACSLPIHETSPLAGLRVVVVDVLVPSTQMLTVAVSTKSAASLYLGNTRVLSRNFAAGGGWVTRFARAKAAAGRVRLSLQVAYRQESDRVSVQVWGDGGEPLRTVVPRRGERASARVTAPTKLEVPPPRAAGPARIAAVAGWLALGESRRAANWLEANPNTSSDGLLDMLRVRAIEEARHLPRNQRRLEVEPIADRALTACPSCWEARIHHATAVQKKRGAGTGIYAAFKKLGVHGNDASWTQQLGPLELAFVAQRAHSADLDDVARTAFDALAERTPNSMLVADLDAELHERHGEQRVRASCQGGTSRFATDCLHAHIARSDLASTQSELRRLRALRGSQGILRHLEVRQLLAHDKIDEAMLIYDALPPAHRTLGVLGIYAGSKAAEGRSRFARDMLLTSGAPYSYEPLARVLGVFDDPAVALESKGANLVARDEKKAFLPGAATAVLERQEHYHLQKSGLLHYWIYDVRRVSGTVDVASGTWMGAPDVRGRSRQRILRRRIFKKDGRVLDPDPKARGAQGHTDLAQLQTGDYVEALVVGWALPEEHGQLTVDTPDILPRRTSVRDGRITFRRPKGVAMSVWAHAELGNATEKRDGDDIVSTWTLKQRAPRRLLRGVPRLEARAGISFGTDSYRRIAKAMAAHQHSLDEADPFMAHWAQRAVGEESNINKRIARIVAAAGKALKRSDPHALSDRVASMGGGAQRETARRMLERGVGSRTWVVHRALREIGITSEIVVSEARPFTAAAGFPARAGRFTHPLIRATIANEDGPHQVIWIDADVSGPPLPPGRVSPELRGRKALRNDGTLLTVNVDATADVDEIALALTVSPEGDASGTVTLELFGRPAQKLVEALEVVVGGRRQRMLQAAVLAWLPWASVGEVTLQSDETSWRVVLRAPITMSGFLQPTRRDAPEFSVRGLAALHTVVPTAASTLGERYVQTAGRTTPLSIDRPLLYRFKRTIELPKNAKVVKLPPPVDVNTSSMKAKRTTLQTGQTLVDTFELNMPASTVLPDAFPSFAKDVRSVDDGFLHGIRVELPALSH